MQTSGIVCSNVKLGHLLMCSIHSRSMGPWDKDDPESKIQSSMRFMSSFKLVWVIIRVERKRLAESAEKGLTNYNNSNRLWVWLMIYNGPLNVITGKPFLDFPLVGLDSKREMRLSDLVKKAGARPLVLNFGSCSWPPFMAKLGEFEALVDKEWIDFMI